ncbi:MAG TPA: hypothetical protein VK582_14940 [Pyrinomonadaceae bacterium]|nr:hypothetical protein [Pyrinomonadaceae bacterium]
MKKKRALTILSVLALTACALAFVWRPHPAAQMSQPQAAEVPVQVMYKHLFHHVIALKKKAAEVEKESKDGTQFRTHFIRKANLTPEQATVLEEVAVELEQDELLISARARPLIEAYKAQYPGGEVPHGQTPAPPPEELKQLSQERDAAVLRALDRLRIR